jgi:hypothetical protein
MPPTLLGKSIKAPAPAAKAAGLSAVIVRRSWVSLVGGCLILMAMAGASASLRPRLVGFSPDDTSVISALAPLEVPVAYATSGTAPLPVSPDLCKGVTIPATPIFPIIPDVVNAGPTGCNPAYWNAAIIGAIGYKGIYILNWFAFVVAVCMTIYAGLLYISGFANEANVKKAKSILVICYTGLIIVFAARIILLGFANTFSDSNNDSINSTITK